MGRGATQAAENQVGINNAYAKNYNKEGLSLQNTLQPKLTQEATNPTGYAPADLSAMNTASQQSVGGATSGAIGEGNLEAARTRNSGGFAPALDEATRSGEKTLSNDALQVQTNNANLKQTQQHDAMSQLEDMYGKNLSATLSSLGMQPGTIGAWNGADNATTGAWSPITQSLISGASSAGAAKLGG